MDDIQTKSQVSEGREKPRRSGAIQVSILIAAAVWAVVWDVRMWPLWTQGGYLHLAFARSLAADQGFGVQGRAVFGEASPLWVALLAGCHRLLGSAPTDWVLGGKVLTTFAAIFFAAGLYQFAENLLATASPGVRRVLPAVIVLVMGLSPYWGAEAFSGSEVLAAAGVACWGCALVAGRLTTPIRPARLLAASLCAGCGPLLRPEMLFFSLGLAPFLFVRWVNTPLRFGLRVFLFFAGLLLAVGPGAAWLLYTVRTFGTALPNTVGAGSAPPGTSVLLRGVVRVAIGSPWLLIALAGLGVWLGAQYAASRSGLAPQNAMKRETWGRVDPSAWLPLAWALLAALYYLATRTAITPCEVLLLAPACTASAFAALGVSRPRWAMMTGAVCGVFGLATSLLFVWPAIPAEQQRERVYAELARTLGRLPGFERVALRPVGEVVFLSANPGVDRVVDLGGVLAPSAAGFRWEVTDARRVWWAHEQGARLMLLDHSPEPGSTAIWWSDLPAGTWENGGGTAQNFDRLVLWRLPPSPTLPAPVALPSSGS